MLEELRRIIAQVKESDSFMYATHFLNRINHCGCVFFLVPPNAEFKAFFFQFVSVMEIVYVNSI